MTDRQPICDFFECGQPVCEADLGLHPPSLRFCQKHSDELKDYIEKGEAKKVLSFWIRSYGGAKRLAETF